MGYILVMALSIVLGFFAGIVANLLSIKKNYPKAYEMMQE